MKRKEWKIGKADEDWKVTICENDIRRAKETISFIEYVLGSTTENFTGAEIKNALLDYASSADQSIARGKNN